MNAKRWYLVELALFVSTLFLIACFPEGFQEQPDGVIIKLEKSSPTDARLLKIQICTASIIRVVASPGEGFSTSPSLMVCQNKWKPVAHTIRKNGNRIQISTSKLMTEVALKTGEIAFYNKDGRLLLQEKPGGSKTFSKTEVMGEKTYQIRQLFLSSPDEAFYGLGQHQNAVMNWKGHDLDMFQYNLVDIVPFVISSRNYGILWDNNSRMKFGDIRDYQPLSTLKMFGIDGKEGGLTAEYFRDEQFQNLVSTRQESIIAHENSDEMGGYPAGFRTMGTSVRWSGEIASDQAGIHDFRFYNSNYAKVWLDGKLVVDSWRQNWCPWTIMRGLPMDFGRDPDVFNINDQFMFGPALLINPVSEYKARTRKVYLPARTSTENRTIDAGWYALKTGKYFKGGQTIDAEAPLSDMPVFVKAGSIVPFGPAIQFAAEKTDPIRLMIYTGANAGFKLYEDEDVNYNYEKGAFSIIPFTYDENAHILTIGDREGKFPGMLKTRTFEIVWVTKDKPSRLDLEAPPTQSVQYNGQEVILKLR